MRFDFVDDDNAVRAFCMFVEINGKAAIGGSDMQGFHGGSYRSVHILLRDAERCQYFFLAFGRRSPMASHRGDYERTGLQFPEVEYDALDDCRKICNAPAAHRDGDVLFSADC